MIKAKKNFNLTDGQSLAIKKIKEFVNSDNKVFILTGAAGTGKTTVVKNIIEKIIEDVSEIKLLAPTNRAAKVLSNKTGILANTIHSEIYLIKEIKNDDGKVIFTKLIPRYLEIEYDQDEFCERDIFNLF